MTRQHSPKTGTARAAALVTVTTYLSYGLSLVVGALMARDLGPGQYGQYAYVVWLSGMLVLFVNNGLTTSGIRFVSENLGKGDAVTAAQVHGWLARWQWISAAVVLAGALLLINYLAPNGWSLGLPLLAGILVSVVLLKSAYIFDISIAKGHRNFGIESGTTAIAAIVNALGVAVLAWRGSTLEEYLYFFIAMSALFWVSASWRVRRAGIRASSPELPEATRRQVAEHVRWTILLVVVGAITNRAVETFLLNHTASAEAVAYFAVAAALTRGGAELLISGLSAVLMPSMAHAYGKAGFTGVSRVLSDTLRLFFFLGIALAGTGYFMAAPIVNVMYGPEYAPAIWAFQVMIVVVGTTLSEGAFGALLSTTDNQRARVMIAVVSVAVTAVVAIILVPPFGYEGAVYATGFSRLFVISWTIWWTRRHFGLVLPRRAMGGFLLSGLIAALLAVGIERLVGGSLGSVMAALMFGGTYVALTVLLRLWTAHDYDTVRGLVGGAPVLGSFLHRQVQKLKQGYASDAEGVWRPGLGHRFAEILGSLPLVAPLKWWHDRHGSPVLILAYHRVMPLPDPATYPFDLELISATPEQFDSQMAYLKRHFHPIRMTDLADHFRTGRPLPRRPVIVTFDDGYDDNLLHAGPILAKYGIVPTIFLSTDYIGSKDPYWFEWVVYLMMRIPPHSIKVEGIEQAMPEGDSWVARRRSGRALQEYLKTLSIEKIHAHLEEWKVAFAGQINRDEFALSGLLTWEQVKAMDGHGFEFGSHSVSHAILAHLDDAALAREMVDSKRIIESQLGHEVPMIAYPVGKEFAFSQRVEDAAKSAGYTLGAAYVAGINFLESIQRFAIKRQNVERAHSDRYFRAMMRFPSWFQ